MSTTTTPMDLFVGLSSVLTGVAADKLAPQLDPVNIKKTYFDFVEKQAGVTFQQLLNLFSQNQGQPPEQIGNVILSQSGDAICYLARSIILVWYLGTWYDPAELQKYNAAIPPTGPVSPMQVVSPAAYTQGWVWSVAQAHPMGHSNFNFGYWSENPPALSDFIGGGS
jgi:hypothetical protein